MSNYIQISFPGIQPEQQEMLIAHLAEAGYTGFEEGELELKAFIAEKDFDTTILHEMVFKYQLQYTEELLPEQNWNSSWEANFQPVLVEDGNQGLPWVAVRADFHEPIPGVPHEIIITPKMSFGTGHHATTHLMVQQMGEIDFTGKKVFDFGTGTGILAILAEKLGATSVMAIDNDDWSIANAEENIVRNDCRKIRLGKADTLTEHERYDIILANINKQVILDNFHSLVGHLDQPGIVLLSGLLSQDEKDIVQQAKLHGLSYTFMRERNNWICLGFNR